MVIKLLLPLYDVFVSAWIQITSENRLKYSASLQIFASPEWRQSKIKYFLIDIVSTYAIAELSMTIFSFFSSLLSFQMQHCYISLHSVKIWKKCTHIFVVMENSIPFSVLGLKTLKVLGKKIRRKEICAAYTFHWIEMRGCVDKASTKWAKPTSLHDE